VRSRSLPANRRVIHGTHVFPSTKANTRCANLNRRSSTFTIREYQSPFSNC